MPRVVLPHANGSYPSDSPQISNQQCVNWYVNIPQAPSLSERTLLGTPGYTELVEAGGANRGIHVMDGVPYFVNGTTLYRLDRTVNITETFTATSLGTISGNNFLSMADNGTQLLLLVPGSNAYIYDKNAETLVSMTDSGFTANGHPTSVKFIDGYFLLTTDSKKFIISDLNDGTAYNALDFATAEADPDNIVSSAIHRNQLYILGSETTEGFHNIGGSDFPFQRNGLVLDKGCYAQHSVVNTSDSFMFVGGGTNESPAVWAFTGGGYQKVSTTAIEVLLNDLSAEELSNIFAYTYSQNGAMFVAFSLADTTIVYDIVTQLWHERKSQMTTNGVTRTTRQRVNGLAQAYNRIIVGDSESGIIGEMSTDVFTEYGNPIIRTLITQPFSDQGRSFSIPRLEATFESGVGHSAVSDPTVRLSTSKDGKTFGNERQLKLGKIGEYNARAIRRRLGRVSRYTHLKFVLSDAVKPAFIKLEADIIQHQ